MSRILTIADQSLLDNILDELPEFKHMEAVSYLVSVYGTENESEYFEGNKYEHLYKFTENEIVDYFGDDLLSEYENHYLMAWIDKDYLYRNVDLDKVLGLHSDKDILDNISESSIIKYLELQGFKVEEETKWKTNQL